MNKLSDLVERKFIECVDVSDWEVETEDGWSDILSINKTIQYKVYNIILENGLALKCADTHIFIDQDYNEVFAKDSLGVLLRTKLGLSRVASVIPLEYEENMYDLSIDSDKHTYYTNNILSHNTQTSVLYLLHYVLFNKDKNVAILANAEKTALSILASMKQTYELLPKWLQQPVKEDGWSSQSIKLENGCRVFASATASNATRGFTLNIVLTDEFAFVPNHIADEFISSVYPTISSGKDSKIIIVSTPNGMNHFHKFWKDAVAGTNTFKPMRVDWWEVPNRDEDFKKRTISDVGIVKWRQEYSCQFIGSTQTLIDAETLERFLIEHQDPIELKYSGAMRIFEEPRKECQYIIGVDSAAGTGGDYSVVQVLKINSETDVQQVAVYANNLISYGEFAQVVIGISQYYNESYLIVENNEIGGHVANLIWFDYEYDKILNTEHNKIGTNANIRTKLAACLNLKKYMESGWLHVYDRRTLEELSSFEEISPNVFKASGNLHDDHVSALYWALYFFKTNYYDGSTGGMSQLDRRFMLEKKKEEEDDNMAPPVIGDVGPGSGSYEIDENGMIWDT